MKIKKCNHKFISNGMETVNLYKQMSSKCKVQVKYAEKVVISAVCEKCGKIIVTIK